MDPRQALIDAVTETSARVHGAAVRCAVILEFIVSGHKGGTITPDLWTLAETHSTAYLAAIRAHRDAIAALRNATH